MARSSSRRPALAVAVALLLVLLLAASPRAALPTVLAPPAEAVELTEGPVPPALEGAAVDAEEVPAEAEDRGGRGAAEVEARLRRLERGALSDLELARERSDSALTISVSSVCSMVSSPSELRSSATVEVKTLGSVRQLSVALLLFFIQERAGSRKLGEGVKIKGERDTHRERGESRER